MSRAVTGFAVRARRVAAAVPGFITGFSVVLWLIGCDHGLTPPAEPDLGFIRARIQYEGGAGSWPPSDSLSDMRFVALRFVPRDTSDLIQLNRLVFSDRLNYNVSEDEVTLSGVAAGPFVYSGVAQKFGPGLFEWRPVGLVTDNGGIFVVSANETTVVDVTVDFDDVPPFPPPLP